MTDKNKVHEDEIDLKELFNTIWRYRYFIVAVTFLITAVAVVYAYTKTPIYEVKSTIRIGKINDTLLDNPQAIAQTASIVFNVGQPKSSSQEGEPQITQIVVSKDNNEFINISSEGLSNEDALVKNKSVLKFLQEEYKGKIKEYKMSINMKMDALDEQLIFLQEVQLQSYEKKIASYRKKYNEYNNAIDKLNEQNIDDATENLIVATQLLSYQNLILNTQNSIENLMLEKERIENKDIPRLNREIALQEQKLSKNNLRDFEVVGEYIVNDYPIKPKKRLIVVVAFVTGVILSIFAIFLIDFFKKIKEDEKDDAV